MFSFHLKIILFAFVSSFVVKLSEAQTYTFTNAGAEGREGPTQEQINTDYLGTNLEGKVTINTQGIQEWVVPADGKYSIEAYGAQGGGASGGLGAKISGNFILTKDSLIKIVVGQKGSIAVLKEGASASNVDYSASGGGGSYVIQSPYDTNSSILTIAGGGGASPGLSDYDQSNLDNGQLTTNGARGFGASYHSNGGVNGEGGETSELSSRGSGGGGFFTDGEGVSNNGYEVSGGSSFINGSMGGFANLNATGSALVGGCDGGFGGGGGCLASGYRGSGGGGGYSGGGLGSVNSISTNNQGGGGGSYNSGTDQNNTSGVNEGHGKVIITLLSPPTYTFTNAGATGRTGPSQSQINLSYAGTNLENNVTIQTEGIQEWTVPVVGSYKIEVFGASGGSSTYGVGGKGAYMSGKFVLEESQLLKIIAGQQGLGNTNGAGGGGGSFVVNALDSTLLIASGGGGGAGGYLETTINPHLQDGKDAVSGTSGTDAQTQGPGAGFTSLGQGGSSGNGGTGGVSNHPGAGGAGFITNGTMGQNTAGYHAFAGVSFSSGFVGGDGRGKPNGGFGGGGSTSHGGGGGGGYSGGGGGVWTHPGGADWGHGGGGGGSYNSGSDQNNTSGFNEGHGKVIITFLGSANEVPVISQGAGPISKVSSEDTQISWSASELNATDSDTNAAQLSWSLLSSPSNGTAVVDGNGSSPEVFTYQPDANYHGSDSFSVLVSDGDANDSITINLTINPVDDPSVISGDSSGVLNEDSSVTGDLNATDVEGLTDDSYFSVSTAPTNGTSSIDATDGNWTYSPNSNFFGNDSFTVTITDDDGNTSTQLISLTVNPVDDPSVISGDTSGLLNEDSSVTGDLNATDIEGLTDGSYFSVSSAPINGTSSIDATDGNWTYSPNSNFFGNDSFTVTITDDDGNTSTQLISLTINPVDDPAVISGDTSGLLNEDSSVTGDLNATDVEGLTDGSYFSISTAPTNGTSSIDATDGNWTYSPNPNFYGSDSFVVTVTDDDGNTSTQLISLTVNPVDDPSVTSGDTSAITNEDNSVTGDLNATDIDGLTDGTYFSISLSPTSGALSINPESGRWTYYPNSNTYGNDSFTVTITDDQGFTSTQVVSLTINPSDDQTSFSGDTNATISEDSIASGDLSASDIDGLTDGSYFSISTNPSNGTASIDAVDGNWTYIPSSDFYGLDSFTITITDDQGYTVTQEISLIVDSIDDASSISGDINATISEDSIASGDLDASDIDGLTDDSYFSISTNPSNGTALIDIEDGNWTYRPSSNFFGTDSFSVTITDDLNYTTTQAISVIINAVDDPTLITGDISGLLFLNHSVTGDLNASDMDGLTDASYFTIQTTPSFGTATVDPVTGSWIYNPQTGFLGDDSFIIQITDDQGFVANQAITLIPQYNVPVAQTESPRLSENDHPIFSGSILYDGGLPILEVGFYTSSSSQFTTSTKLPGGLANGSSTFTLELNQTELTSTIFVRAFARNQNGETLGEIKRLDPAPIVMQWSSHATVLDNGWMQSDWFGTFNHFPQNWIFHSRLGWLYIPDSTTEELWLWAPDHEWVWTEKNVFPHLYKNSTGTWLYLLDQEMKGKNFYDYQSGLFE